MCSADPADSNIQYGADHTIKGYSMATGPYNHRQYGYYSNPGQVDIHNTNPALGGLYDDMGSMRSDFQSTLDRVMDPGSYNNLRDEYAQRAGTSLNNRFASMGLAGSSAAVGALNESDRQTALSFRDRQLGEQTRAIGVASGLDKAREAMLLAGQGQYGAWQDQLLGIQMGQQQAYQQQVAAENQMWGQIASAAIGTVGTAVAGPAGGAAAKAGSAGVSAMNYGSPSMFGDSGWNSPYYGNIGGPGMYGGPDYYNDPLG